MLTVAISVGLIMAGVL